MKIGTTLIPLVGWMMDTRQPDRARARRFEAIRTLVEGHNMQAVELNGDFALLYPQLIDEAYYQQVADLQEELGFTCTFHLPFLWLDGASLNEAIRQATIESARQVLEMAKSLNIESYVMHLWGLWTSVLADVQEMPQGERHSLLRELLRRAEYTLTELAAFVSPAAICVENLGRFPFDQIIPLVGRHGMRICLDVGHLAVQGGDPLAFVTQHWEQIGEIHLHDALPKARGGPGLRDHLPLGEGEVDYVAFMRTLEERGYDKVVILEVNNEADLMQSLDNLRPWL